MRKLVEKIMYLRVAFAIKEEQKSSKIVGVDNAFWLTLLYYTYYSKINFLNRGIFEITMLIQIGYF